MSETSMLHYICSKETFHPSIQYPVRWLDSVNDFELGRQLFEIAEQDSEPLQRIWSDVEKWGYQFCAVVEHDIIIAKAAIWRYSEPAWDLASVGVMNENNMLRSFGKSVCSFVTSAILDADQIATCSTGSYNTAMQRTAESIGYQYIEPAMLPAVYPRFE